MAVGRRLADTTPASGRRSEPACPTNWAGITFVSFSTSRSPARSRSGRSRTWMMLDRLPRAVDDHQPGIDAIAQRLLGHQLARQFVVKAIGVVSHDYQRAKIRCASSTQCNHPGMPSIRFPAAKSSASTHGSRSASVRAPSRVQRTSPTGLKVARRASSAVSRRFLKSSVRLYRVRK